MPGLLAAGLREELLDTEASLYRVPDAKSDGVTASGTEVRVPQTTPVIGRPDTSEGFTWYRGSQDGWLRGGRVLHPTSEGAMQVPSGGGVIWFWPALLVLATYTAVVIVAVHLFRRGRSRPRIAAVEPDGGG